MNTIFQNSKKNLLKFTLLACLSLPIVSCSNDDDNASPVAAAQNPLGGYITAAGFDQMISNAVNATDYEFGSLFRPLSNGKITAITVKIPDIRAGLRVTIWDKATKTVLRTETIDITSSGVEFVKEISPLALVKDKEYAITFNSNDWYRRWRTDNSSATYPISVGDIQITGYGFAIGTAQVFPTDFPTYYYAGDLGFKFQKD